MKTTCPSCGTTYEGWKCPTCTTTARLKEQAAKSAEEISAAIERSAERVAQAEEATRDAYERESFRRVEAAAKALEQQKQLAAQSWQIQANAKANRAYELYSAGLFDEAIALATRVAQDEDPSNLLSYIVRSWSLGKLGRTADATRDYEKQLALLEIHPYRLSPSHFYRVVAALPDVESLLRGARSVFAQTVSQWPADSSLQDILTVFARKAWPGEMQLLARRMREQAAPIDLAKVAPLLAQAGLSEEAVSLAKASAARSPSLIAFAWWLELDLANRSQVETAVKSWLGSVASTNRSEVRTQLAMLLTSQKACFTRGTLDAILYLVQGRLAEWQESIAESFTLYAKTEAKDKERHRAFWKGATFGINPTAFGFLLWLSIGVLIPVAIARTFPRWAPSFLWTGLEALFASIPVSWALWAFARLQIFKKVHEDARTSESANWAPLLSDPQLIRAIERAPSPSLLGFRFTAVSLTFLAAIFLVQVGWDFWRDFRPAVSATSASVPPPPVTATQATPEVRLPPEPPAEQLPPATVAPQPPSEPTPATSVTSPAGLAASRRLLPIATDLEYHRFYYDNITYAPNALYPKVQNMKVSDFLAVFTEEKLLAGQIAGEAGADLNQLLKTYYSRNEQKAFEGLVHFATVIRAFHPDESEMNMTLRYYLRAWER